MRPIHVRHEITFNNLRRNEDFRTAFVEWIGKYGIDLNSVSQDSPIVIENGEITFTMYAFLWSAHFHTTRVTFPYLYPVPGHEDCASCHDYSSTDSTG